VLICKNPHHLRAIYENNYLHHPKRVQTNLPKQRNVAYYFYIAPNSIANTFKRSQF
jgi:hypothetical protein